MARLTGGEYFVRMLLTFLTEKLRRLAARQTTCL